MRKTLLYALSNNEIISTYELLNKYDLNDNRDLWSKKTSELLSIFLSIETYQDQDKFLFLNSCSNLDTILKFKSNISVSHKIKNYLFSLSEYSNINVLQQPITKDQHHFLSTQPIVFITKLNNIFIDDIVISNNWFNSKEKKDFFIHQFHEKYNLTNYDIEFFINYFLKFENINNFDLFKMFIDKNNGTIAQFIINFILKNKFNDYSDFIKTINNKISKIDNKNEIYSTIKKKNTTKKEIIKI